MKIIKRNGAEAVFDLSKIESAITRANAAVAEQFQMTTTQIHRIAESVALSCQEMGRSPAVEEIQDLVEKAIMAHGAFEVAKQYITYRYTRSLIRRSNTTDDRILSLIESNNEEVKQENANKNPTVNAVQRDYYGRRGLAKTSPGGSCCPRKWWKPTRRASFTSTTRIIMPSTCTIATW
ncbi:MAG: ATP cone domain-containing protein [Oscillospiraceae bacterium]